jgi:hypothetical protein
MPLFFNAAAAEMTEQGEPFLIYGGVRAEF